MQKARKKTGRRTKSRTARLSDLELCARFQKGDLLSFTELSKCYAKLLETVAEKYAGQQLPKPELILHAKIGLLKAAHRYDESKMVSFRLYAIWWMRQSILKALHEQAHIEKIPEMLIMNMHEIINSFRQEKMKLNNNLEFVEISDAVEEQIVAIQRVRIKKTGT